MVRGLFVAIAVAIVLVGCGGAPVEPAAVAPTSAPAAAPTEVPTPVPLDQIDLASLVLLPDELPKGLTPGDSVDRAPEAWTQMPRPQALNIITQDVQHGSDPAGYIVVALYDDLINVNKAYEVEKFEITESAKLTSDTVDELTDIGKEALAVTSTSLLPGTHLAFQRCRAVVTIYMVGDLVDTETVGAYAKKLDERLTQAVCR